MSDARRRRLAAARAARRAGRPAGRRRACSTRCSTAVDEQRRLLEADIDQVWDDLFIESCADWAVPYIGALLGLPADAGRLEVAYAVALRRRKGTPGGARGLRRGAHGLDGAGARGLAGHALGAAARAPAAAARRRRSTCATARASASARRSSAPAAASRRRAAGRRARRRRSSGRGRCARYRAPRRRRCPSPPLRAAPARRRGAALPAAAAAAARRATPDPAARRTRTSDELDAPVRADLPGARGARRAEDRSPTATNWTIAAAHPLAEPDRASRALAAALTVDGHRGAVGRAALRRAAARRARARAARRRRRRVVDVARGHVELGAGLAGPLRATWHRPVPGRARRARGRRRRRPGGARRRRRSTRRCRPSATSCTRSRTRSRSAEARSAGLDPAESDARAARRRDPAGDLRPARRPAGRSPSRPTLPRWRIVAPRSSTPTIVGDLEPRPRAARCLTLEGFSLSGDLRLGTGLEASSLRNLTMDPAAGRDAGRAPRAPGGCRSAPSAALLGADPRRPGGARRSRSRDCVVDGCGAALRVCGGDAGRRAHATPSRAAGASTRRSRADGVTFAGAGAASRPSTPWTASSPTASRSCSSRRAACATATSARA